jgi:hypothetical protein
MGPMWRKLQGVSPCAERRLQAGCAETRSHHPRLRGEEVVPAVGRISKPGARRGDSKLTNQTRLSGENSCVLAKRNEFC